MGFRQDGFATVWQVEGKSPTMTVVRVSTSRKNRDTNQFEQDFSGFVAFVGRDNAANALRLRNKDRIKLGHVDVTTTYNKETKKEFVNYTCFNFEMASGSQDAPAPQRESTNPVDGGDNEGQISEGQLPF